MATSKKQEAGKATAWEVEKARASKQQSKKQEARSKNANDEE